MAALTKPGFLIILKILGDFVVGEAGTHDLQLVTRNLYSLQFKLFVQLFPCRFV